MISARIAAAVLATFVALGLRGPAGVDGQQRGVNRIAAGAGGELRLWDAQVDRMARDGRLRLRLDRHDTVMPGRRHRRFVQIHDGVPVHGAEITRQTDRTGATVSIFGTLHDGVTVPAEPTLTAEEARNVVMRASGVETDPSRLPRLIVLPREDGSYRLVYAGRAATAQDITLYFVDAHTGEIVGTRSDAQTQVGALGVGVGVLGDSKKLQATTQGGTFVQVDQMRPPRIETYDMRGDVARTLAFLNGGTTLGQADLGTDSDNDWNDGANVDAHTYAGYTYDYYYRRFGRLGLDNANITIRSLTHPVHRLDITTAPDDVIGLFFVNAFYAGDGVVVYGEGLPPGFVTRARGQSWNYLAGALDVVAHELTHGVIDYSSQLVYQGESGALNEAFCDIIGTAAEFFFQQPGTGPLRADYLIAEDVVTPGGIRSMENPGEYGQPDHYSRRSRGVEDNGGVHVNSGIPNHAYYLAVEGGTNRTSGLAVQGVGRANREQMEKVFFRAFTQLMPAGATFSTARAATLQAARDLYGAGSAAERAIMQAWTAVGVE